MIDPATERLPASQVNRRGKPLSARGVRTKEADFATGTEFVLPVYFARSGYSCRRLALIVGMTEENVRNLVSGQSRMFRLSTLDKLAYVFGCTVADFFSGDPSRPSVGRLDLLSSPVDYKHAPQEGDVEGAEEDQEEDL